MLGVNGATGLHSGRERAAVCDKVRFFPPSFSSALGPEAYRRQWTEGLGHPRSERFYCIDSSIHESLYIIAAWGREYFISCSVGGFMKVSAHGGFARNRPSGMRSEDFSSFLFWGGGGGKK